MEDVKPPTTGRSGPSPTPCLCAALRQAARAVTRLYDAELRATGLKTTQHALLKTLDRLGESRQSDLGEAASLDETTLTRNLRPLQRNGWVTIRAGVDRREKWISITESGKAKVDQARAAWLRVQDRLRKAVPDGTWSSLLEALPAVAKAAQDEAS